MIYRVCSTRSAHRLLTASAVGCMLVLAGCGRSGQAGVATLTPTPVTPAPTTTPLPTPTPSPEINTLPNQGGPVQGPTPAWIHTPLPSGFGMLFHDSDIAVSPSNGEIAYACTTTLNPPAKTSVVVTNNGGVSWGPIRQATSTMGGCSDAMVDAMVPTTAILYGSPNPMGTGVLTRDGGSTWQPYTIPNGGIWSLATVGGSTYAILESDASSGVSSSLEISKDGMRTWQPISVPSGTGGTDVLGFWGPDAGSMLAETGTNGTEILWRSSDSGAHWTGVPLPLPAVSGIEAAPGARAGSWDIYVQYDDSTGFGQIAYSTNLGAAWTVLPNFDPNGGVELSGIGSDGAALARESSNPVTLYRFIPGTTRWQSLGALPQSADWITCAPTPGGAMLWAFPAESDGAGGYGPPNAVYTAPYPAGS